jgi:hypothetical protein
MVTRAFRTLFSESKACAFLFYFFAANLLGLCAALLLSFGMSESIAIAFATMLFVPMVVLWSEGGIAAKKGLEWWVRLWAIPAVGAVSQSVVQENKEGLVKDLTFYLKSVDRPFPEGQLQREILLVVAQYEREAVRRVVARTVATELLVLAAKAGVIGLAVCIVFFIDFTTGRFLTLVLTIVITAETAVASLSRMMLGKKHGKAHGVNPVPRSHLEQYRERFAVKAYSTLTFAELNKNDQDENDPGRVERPLFDRL